MSTFRDQTPDVGFHKFRARIAVVSAALSAEDLFADMAGMELLPVVVGKVDELTARNAKALQVGSIGQLGQVGHMLYANVMISDGQAVRLLRSGSKLELVVRRAPSGAVAGHYVAIVSDSDAAPPPTGLAAHLTSLANPLGIESKPAPVADSAPTRPGHSSVDELAQYLAHAAHGWSK